MLNVAYMSSAMCGCLADTNS